MLSYRLIWSRSRRTMSPRYPRSTRSNSPDSEPSQVIPISSALRFPSLSMRSGWIMGCPCAASGRDRCAAGRSKFLSTNLVRSPMARSRAWLSFSNWLQTVLILSLSRVIRPSSLFNLWTMSSTSSNCKSADPLGEPGGNCGTGGGWPVGDSVDLNTISDSSSSPNTGPLSLLPCSFSLCFPPVPLRSWPQSHAEREYSRNFL